MKNNTDKLTSLLKGYGRIGFFGPGSSNLFLLSRLPEGCRAVIRSDTQIDRSILPLNAIDAEIFEGEHALDSIDEEMLILSPSVRRDRPAIAEAARSGVRLSSDAELFFAAADAPIFAVSGSDGKSTTAALAAAMLQKSRRTLLGGNIGVPMTSLLGQGAEAYVIELSSFMLNGFTPHSRRAVITNVTENHLNWHVSFDEYKNAKRNLTDGAEEYVISADDPVSREFAAERKPYAAVYTDSKNAEAAKDCGAKLLFGCEDGLIVRNGQRLFPADLIKLKGRHNLSNLLLALALTDGYVAPQSAADAAESFAGLAHRCEEFLYADGIRFIDSSIDTSPLRTANTLASLGGRTVLILAGIGKGQGYQPILSVMAERVRVCVATGSSARSVMGEISRLTYAEYIEDFEGAVKRAAELAEAGDTLLLSPAATSYDHFADYKQRGERFKEIIKGIFGEGSKVIPKG